MTPTQADGHQPNEFATLRTKLQPSTPCVCPGKVELIFQRVVLLVLFLCAGGCAQQTIDRSWAAHAYPTKTSSLNGLGYLEKLCAQKGAKFKSVNRLSPRLDRVDCLVLVGDTLHPPAKEARDWIEKWLGQKSGRKVLYFGRDFDAGEYYMNQTLADQPIDKLARARLDAAEVRSERDDILFEQMNDDYFCRWFYVRVSKPQRVLQKFSGPWSDQLGELNWPVRAYLDWADPELREDQPDWTVAAPATGPTIRLPRALRTGPKPPVAPPTATPRPARKNNTNNTNNPRSVFTSYWIPLDIATAEEWEQEWDLVPVTDELLVGEDGTPLIMRLTSARYPGSEIITLANGAPIFNGMMINESMRTLCMKIADQIGDNSRVAYLRYDQSGIQVSEIPDLEDEVAGLSVLMTWPLNILMAHLAFLGILICVAMFPILGRPQEVKHSRVSDFGQHAEAMGQMLLRTKDWPFALKLVSEYLRTVRGETLPAWLQSELSQHTAPPTLIPEPVKLESQPETKEPRSLNDRQNVSNPFA